MVDDLVWGRGKKMWLAVGRDVNGIFRISNIILSHWDLKFWVLFTMNKQNNTPTHPFKIVNYLISQPF